MIVITGASKGIGKYLKEAYLEQGELVLGTYFKTNPKNSEIGMSNVDISNQNSIETWINSIKEQLNNIVLINCAGINYNSIGHKADKKKWADVINVNLIGTFNVVSSFLPIMRDQQFGRIINLSSVVAQKGIPGTSAYASSKSGLWGLTKSLAVENAKYGITINSLNLGYFDIGMISEVPKEIQINIKKMIPTQNFGNPKNILDSIEFLRKADYLNGSSININGGIL